MIIGFAQLVSDYRLGPQYWRVMSNENNLTKGLNEMIGPTILNCTDIYYI